MAGNRAEEIVFMKPKPSFKKRPADVSGFLACWNVKN
jgi:hypothetical protein